MDHEIDVDRRFAQLMGVPYALLREPGIHYAEDTEPQARPYMGFAVHFLAVMPLGASSTVVAAPRSVCEGIRESIAASRGGGRAALEKVLLDAAGALHCQDTYLCDVLVGRPPTLTLARSPLEVEECPGGATNVVDWNGVELAREVDGPLFVIRDGQGLRAWAGIKRVSPWAQDIQVATRPDLRRRGLGLKVASAAVDRIASEGITPYYAHLTENAASASLARALGFRPYGRVIFAESRQGRWVGGAWRAEG